MPSELTSLLQARTPVVWAERAAADAAADASVLIPAERERLAKLKHPRVAAEYLHGRSRLRTALGLWLGIEPAEVPLTVNAHGKPIHVDGAVEFNISHTNGWLAFAVSNSPIGVDVEVLQTSRDLAGLVQRYFSAHEQGQFAALPPSLHAAAFSKGWTCKEALLKAIGTGMRDVQRCTVNLHPDQPAEVLANVPATGFWRLASWMLDDVTRLAVACPSTNVFGFPHRLSTPT